MGDDYREETWLFEVLWEEWRSIVQSTTGNIDRSDSDASELVRFLPDFSMCSTRDSGTNTFQCHLGFVSHRSPPTETICSCPSLDRTTFKVDHIQRLTFKLYVDELRFRSIGGKLTLRFSFRCHLYYNWPVSNRNRSPKRFSSDVENSFSREPFVCRWSVNMLINWLSSLVNHFIKISIVICRTNFSIYRPAFHSALVSPSLVISLIWPFFLVLFSFI